MSRTLAYSALGIFTLTLLAGISPAQAGEVVATDCNEQYTTACSARYDETYESFAPGSFPADAQYYNMAQAGTGSYDIQTVPGYTGTVFGSGPKALRVVDTAAAPFIVEHRFTTTPTDLCASVTPGTGGSNSRFDSIFIFQAPTGLAAGAVLEIRWTSAASVSTTTPSNTIGVRITGVTVGADPMVVFQRNSAGTEITQSFGATGLATAGNWYEFDVFEVDCANALFTAQMIDRGSDGTGTLIMSPGSIALDNAGSITGPLNGLEIGNTASVIPGANYHLTFFRLDAYPAPEAPQVISVSPNSGPVSGGNRVQITGLNLMPAGNPNNCVFKFGGVPATDNEFVTDDGYDVVEVTVPAHGAGVVSVGADCPNGYAEKSSAYTYVASSQVIDIVSVTPAQGTIGSTVTVLVNRNDAVGEEIKFGTRVAEITDEGVDGSTPAGHKKYRVAAPPNAPGVYDVTFASSNYAIATQTQAFTYVASTFDGECPNYRPYNYEGYGAPFEEGTFPERCWYTFTPTEFDEFLVTEQRAYPSTTLTFGSLVFTRPESETNQSQFLKQNEAAVAHAKYALKPVTVQGQTFLWKACDDRFITRNEWAFRHDGASPNGPYLYGVTDKATLTDTTAHAGYLTVNYAGTTTVTVRNLATVNTNNHPATLVKGQWYLASAIFSCTTIETNGSNNIAVYQYCVRLHDETGVDLGAQCGTITPAPAPTPVGISNFVYTTPALASESWLDELRFALILVKDARFTPDAGDEFRGFDVTRAGDYMITRSFENDDSDNIQAWRSEASSVVKIDGACDSDAPTCPGDGDNNCEQPFGVIAYNSQALGYFQCEPSIPAGDFGHKTLEIVFPNDFDTCPGEDDGASCTIGEPTTESDTGGSFTDDAWEPYKMVRFPIDNSQRVTANPAGGITFFQREFAFTEKDTGRVGVYRETSVEGGDDDGDVAFALFADETVTQLCVASADVVAGTEEVDNEGDGAFDFEQRNGGVQDILVAVHPGVGVGIWYVSYDDDGAPSLERVNVVNPELTNAISVDCSKGLAVIGTEEGNVYVISLGNAEICDDNENAVECNSQGQLRAGQILQRYDFDGTPVRAVSISQSSRYAVGCRLVGTVFACVVLDLGSQQIEVELTARGVPLGTFNQPYLTLRMDQRANYLYIMFSDSVVRFPLLEALHSGIYQEPNQDANLAGTDDFDNDCLEDEDDPNWTDGDQDGDNIRDCRDTCVDTDGDGDCDYNGAEIQERCQGEEAGGDECQELIDDALGRTSSTGTKSGSFGLIGEACDWASVLIIIALGFLGWLFGGRYSTQLSIGATVFGIGVSSWKFCLPDWLLYMTVAYIVVSGIWAFMRR